VICDRGAMDPSAYIDADSWQRMLDKHKLNSVDLRDNRYNQVGTRGPDMSLHLQIVHMVTAADGAEKFYSQLNNKTRSEGVIAAIEQDRITRKVSAGRRTREQGNSLSQLAFSAFRVRANRITIALREMHV
jgi:hypothetical protein